MLNDPALAASDQGRIPSQRSVKAYVDAQIPGAGHLANVVEDTTPQLGGMLDVNGNVLGDGTREILKFSEDGAAVNEITIGNAATLSGPVISATGDDTDIDLYLAGKGTGLVRTLASDFRTANIEVTGTVDGRDVATDGTKLDGIETAADVTDVANVRAAGGLRQYISSSRNGSFAAGGGGVYLRMGGAQPCSSTIGFPMHRAGSITAIVGQANITSYSVTGTTTFELRINDVLALSCAVVVSAAGIVKATPVTQASGIDTFVAGDVLQTFANGTGTYTIRPFMSFELEFD